MPELRHLKQSPKPCICAMCTLHKQNRETLRWMRAHPAKVTYLADGVSTAKAKKSVRL